MAASFPSLVISAAGLSPRGAFASAQADYLTPDPELVDTLTHRLREVNAGVVAHFYMDPELQGVLSASSWPHIHISDSLWMADAAVKMADAGVGTCVVLGVDFMSENVRAMLDAAGHGTVSCYRVAAEPIGCSLAESAESRAYEAYLRKAASVPSSLHVVYVNTSLRTKAHAQQHLPTITCTSSNVVHTVLQATAQVPDLQVWFGPDTYMGRNLRTLFTSLLHADDETIRAVHPGHDRASIAGLIERFHFFEQGVCIVHQMFGADVANRVRRDHADAFIAAHLEVPGEMFEIGLQAQRRGRGVVGSTANILGFITTKVADAVQEGGSARLSFVLGTEAGMITSIVRAVQKELRGTSDVEVEIVFPVASEAIVATSDPSLPVVPGAPTGEGCSIEGGCATCPYMKMNSLDALFDVLDAVRDGARDLKAFRPRAYPETIDGRTMAEVGAESILHMRHLQRTGELSPALIADITTRNRATA
jgi:quinolinate synthase